MDFSTPTLDLIKHDLKNAQVVNSDQVLYNRIKEAGNSKQQLQKAAEEFEAIFITKMLTEMDKTVDREDGLFGEKSPYVDTFKSIVYQQIGGKIKTKSGNSIVIYTQKKERLSAVAKEAVAKEVEKETKEEVIKETSAKKTKKKKEEVVVTEEKPVEAENK